MTNWSPQSWRNYPSAQQPNWPDELALEHTLKQLSTFPPLVFAEEARSLTHALGLASKGEAFLLQAGDCSESFEEFSADAIRDKLKVILQMAILLTYSAGVPVIKVGRIAGQFAKPRSSDTETVNGIKLAAFRGHMVNDDAPTIDARRPDPNRLLLGYHQSAATLNLLRAFTKGGFADLSKIHVWNQEFVASSKEGQRYEIIAQEIQRALKFMRACGINLSSEKDLQQVDFWTSHEALLLGYEEALTRKDSLSGDFYDCSAHLLWVGERTRSLEGAHMEFLSGISNPIAVKLSATASPDEVLAICEKLNPNKVEGRLSLITRMGSTKITDSLPAIVRAVKKAGHPVVWVCDPMHGNTFKSENGIKTRHLNDILTEIKGFFQVHKQEGTIPGGVHIELTGDNVTECLGGVEEIFENDLGLRYTSTCDPRLNAKQSLDLAFNVAEFLRNP